VHAPLLLPLYRPTLQLVHASAFVLELDAVYLPASQSTQLLRPMLDWYWPGAHDVHTVWPYLYNKKGEFNSVAPARTHARRGT
jgi:hypothetical protein